MMARNKHFDKSKLTLMLRRYKLSGGISVELYDQLRNWVIWIAYHDKRVLIRDTATMDDWVDKIMDRTLRSAQQAWMMPGPDNIYSYLWSCIRRHRQWADEQAGQTRNWTPDTINMCDPAYEISEEDYILKIIDESEDTECTQNYFVDW